MKPFEAATARLGVRPAALRARPSAVFFLARAAHDIGASRRRAPEVVDDAALAREPPLPPAARAATTAAAAARVRRRGHPRQPLAAP